MTHAINRGTEGPVTETISAVILFLLLSYGGLGAQTFWYVDASAPAGGNGSSTAPFQSIMDAVNVCASGDLLYLAPGSYEGGNVDLGLKNLTIASLLGPSTVTITSTLFNTGVFKIDGPASGKTYLFDLDFSAGLGTEFIVSAKNTQLSMIGCTFERTNLGLIPTVGPLSYPPPQLLIDGCVFDDAVVLLEHEPQLPGTTATVINSEFKSTQPIIEPVSRLVYSSVVIDSCHVHDYAFMSVSAESGTITSCVFEDQPSAWDALELQGSNIDVSSCNFRRCSRAIFLTGHSQLIETSTFEGCGVGISNSSFANCVIRDCSFADLPQGTGSYFSFQQGVRSYFGDLTIDRCSFRDLNGYDGTAVSTSTPLTMRDCTIQDCVALYSGGAVHVNQTYFDISNCSFVDNAAPLGSTLHVVPGSLGRVRNSIIRGNSPQHIFGQIDLSYCDIQGGWTGPGGENFDTDPLFVDPSSGDLHLAAGSPCLDAGDYDTFGLAALDLDGNPRIEGNYVDLGAFESPGGPATLAGSGDDLLMIAKNNNVRINSGSITVTGGDVIALSVLSPRHGLDGFPVWLMGELFPTGGSPVLPVGHPAIHLNLSVADVILDPSISTGVSGWALGLPATGLELSGPVPFGFTGNSYRLQAFMLAPGTINGWYAASQACDLRHQ